MAHPLVWRGRYFFYPMGNTSAVSLSRHLAPEEDAAVLLLGCGDPRSILYTIYNEPRQATRKLDFTCCDMEPAVLARNVLLLSMIFDRIPNSPTIWNIFFHMHLDKESYSVLISQCRKLIDVSAGIESWNKSPYGRFLRMCTEQTLNELRRHWQLYADMDHLPLDRLNIIKKAFDAQFKHNSRNAGSMLSTARSSGPLLASAVNAVSAQFKQYWSSGGVTLSKPKEITAASILNPTFVYSLAGEGCNVHYGTDPIMTFHLAALFGNSKHVKLVTAADTVKAAKAEFEQWCLEFYSAICGTNQSAPIVRFFLGEATAVCSALEAFSSTNSLTIGVPVAPWKATLIELSTAEYIDNSAPSTFDVIDTSNLNDHIGLLNVLIATVPLLSPSLTSTLYTESLLFQGLDATKEFSARLYVNISTAALLLGICPVDYLSGFGTRSNTHELMMSHLRTQGDPTSSQFHEVTTWKSPSGGDSLAAYDAGGTHCPMFDTRQLGTLLYDTYHQIYEQEDSRTHVERNSNNMLRAMATSNLVHYIRESFVRFLKIVQRRLALSNDQWQEVMECFFHLQTIDSSMPMDSINFQDFATQLFRHSVYRHGQTFWTRGLKIGRFARWETIPHLVRVILVVPRDKLRLHEKALDECGTPPLQCDLRGTRSHNVYSHLHASFGTVMPKGTAKQPRIIFVEDPAGWRGESSLVVSFVVATVFLTHIEPPENISISMGVRSTLGTVGLVKSLGLYLTFFSAKLMDEAHVFIVPEDPLPSMPTNLQSANVAGLASSRMFSREIGQAANVTATLDEQCELIASLTARISVQDADTRLAFSAGASPTVVQVSPCVMRITLGRHLQHVAYPFPIIGSANKLRLARKSQYIEVVVPVAGPQKPDGMQFSPFPVIGGNGGLALWNIHRVNLQCLPILDLQTRHLSSWLNPHVGSSMSNRERDLRKVHAENPMMRLKDNIHTLFVAAAGIQPKGRPQRVFSLAYQAPSKSRTNTDTILFIDQLRFDLDSHTVVADAYVTPLTSALCRQKLSRALPQLLRDNDMVNVEIHEGEIGLWKQLLPALVERCRTWSHGPNCEYKAQGNIPLTELMEIDPLCSCGRGKDVDGMHKIPSWANFAPYATRVALSPLFAVSYLEQVGRDPNARKCFRCRSGGKPKIMECTGCNAVRYCSKACQKLDWPSHKPKCKS